MSAKVAPDETEYTEEAPPPGWKQPDEPEGPPALDEAANDEFLAASRKARADALANRGKRRYNLALRVVGVLAIFNMLVSCVPLIDGVYVLSWIRVSGVGTNYALNHHTIINARSATGDSDFAPQMHLFLQYQCCTPTGEDYDSSYYDVNGNVQTIDAVAAADVPATRDGFCAVAQRFVEIIAANNQIAPMDPWCLEGVDTSFSLAVCNLVAAWLCVVLWYVLLQGDGDVPPYRTFKYAPPDAEHPDGKSWVLTPYHLAAMELLQGCVSARALL